MALPLSLPEKISPIKVMFNTPKDAAPIPCINLANNKIWKLLINAHDVPAIANKNKEGISTIFLPILSDKIPKSGVRMMPGSVKTAINQPTFSVFILKWSIIFGNAGVRLATPNTAINVIA